MIGLARIDQVPCPRADRDRSLLSSHSAQGPHDKRKDLPKAVAVVRPGFDQVASAAAVRRRYVMNPMHVKPKVIIAQVVHFFRSDWVVRVRRQWQARLYTFCENDAGLHVKGEGQDRGGCGDGARYCRMACNHRAGVVVSLKDAATFTELCSTLAKA